MGCTQGGCCCAKKPEAKQPDPVPDDPPPVVEKPQFVEGQENWMGEFEYLFTNLRTDEEKRKMVKQLENIDDDIGLRDYIQRAKTLLKEAQDGVNPFEGMQPAPAKGVDLCLSNGDLQTLEALAALEKIGEGELGNCAFVLVAGGMGERLGFGSETNPRIKVSIVAETTTEATFMEMYCQYIIAFQKKSGNVLPLVIMTSDETDALTKKFMEKEKHFGLAASQVVYMKQKGVPALSDLEAHIAVAPDGKIIRKPHGHGDVHGLLHKQGLVQKWANENKKWLVVFQDTNPLHFRCLTAILGVSEKEKFAMNTVAVPRMPGEKVGGITELKKQDGSSMTINVEYNQLEAVLGKGNDVAVEGSKYSAYPGNTNILVFDIPKMAKILEKSQGQVDEFVNPKWKDENVKTELITPTRLECMMQDFPKLMKDGEKVGFTLLDRDMCFTCVKNQLSDAKNIKSGSPDCALSCEADIYKSNVLALMRAAKLNKKEVIVKPEMARWDPQTTETFAGITVPLGPRVVLRPSFGISVSDIARRINGDLVLDNQKKNCALVLDGDIQFEGDGNNEAMILDGAIHIKQTQDPITIKGLDCFNEGQKIVQLSPNECGRKTDPESYNIRKYGANVSLQDMYTRNSSWDGAGRDDGDLTNGGTFKIKAKGADQNFP